MKIYFKSFKKLDFTLGRWRKYAENLVNSKNITK